MEHLKKELFLKLDDTHWLVLHYSNEKFDLFFHKEQGQIKFHLSNKTSQNIVLSGLVFKHNATLEFQYNEQESSWLHCTRKINIINTNEITDLLENLFCSMLIQGDSK